MYSIGCCLPCRLLRGGSLRLTGHAHAEREHLSHHKNMSFTEAAIFCVQRNMHMVYVLDSAFHASRQIGEKIKMAVTIN